MFIRLLIILLIIIVNFCLADYTKATTCPKGYDSSQIPQQFTIITKKSSVQQHVGKIIGFSCNSEKYINGQVYLNYLFLDGCYNTFSLLNENFEGRIIYNSNNYNKGLQSVDFTNAILQYNSTSNIYQLVLTNAKFNQPK